MAQSWVDEALRPGYDFDKASTTKPGTEQFTQVVWRATTQVGMALSEDEKLLGFETIVKLDIWYFLVMMKQKQVFVGCGWCGSAVWLKLWQIPWNMRFQCLSRIEILHLVFGARRLGRRISHGSTLGPEKLTHAWANKTVRRKVGAYCKSQLWEKFG